MDFFYAATTTDISPHLWISARKFDTAYLPQRLFVCPDNSSVEGEAKDPRSGETINESHNTASALERFRTTYDPTTERPTMQSVARTSRLIAFFVGRHPH